MQQLQRSMVIGVLAGWALCAAGAWAAETTEQTQTAQTIQDGMAVEIDYTLTVDSSIVDSSQGRGPLSYVQGHGQIIPGLERQLAGLSVGDSRDITVNPEEGYGRVDPAAFVDVQKEQLPAGVTPEVGMTLGGTDPTGRPIRARVTKINDKTVTLDLNHPLAGKTLHFNVKVVSVGPATPAKAQ